MDDFGTLARDLGFKPQGKSAPMATSKSTFVAGSDGGDRRTRSSSSFSDDRSSDGLLFSDVFGGGPKYTSSTTINNDKSSKTTTTTTTMSDFDYDSIFKTSSSATNDSKPKPPSVPVYDKPVYDDDVDIFDGLPGLKSKSTTASVSYSYDEDAFSSFSSPPPKQRDQFDDLLGNLGRTQKAESKRNKSSNSNSRGLDDLIPGFGGSSPSGNHRPVSESSEPEKTTVNLNNATSSVMEDLFVDVGSTSVPVDSSTRLFNDPLEEISKLGNAGSTKVDGSYSSGGIFDDIDPLNGFGKSVPSFSNMNGTQTSASKEAVGKYPSKNSESHPQKKMPVDSFQDSDQTPFEMPAASSDSHQPVGHSQSQSESQTTSTPSFLFTNPDESSSRVDMSPRSEEDVENSDDVWLTVSDFPLFTPPTTAPPPSRPPPPVPARAAKAEKGSFMSNARRRVDEFYASQSSSQYSQSPKIVRPTPKSPITSQVDELENFATGRTQVVDEHAEVHSGDEVNTNSAAAASAAAMKEAMDRAEAKFRHAKEVREREYAKAGRNKEAMQPEKEEQATQDVQEREFRENRERLDRERRQREREEEEREHRRLEKERERMREMERERELGRQAVERATREARERAAAEARGRAAAETRLKSERAVVDKVNAEARGRAERVAVQRAQTEARERAAAEAKERAEKVASEARERANAEARDKAAVARAEAEARRRAERAAVERAAAEARERAATAARERAASASRMSQQKNDDDFESFFSTGSRPSSVPRPRGNSSDPVVDPSFQSRGGPEASRRTSSVGASSNMRKASSATNVVDDLSSIFGAAPSAGEFQEVEGESEERRRARLERQQRTHERAAKALTEMNQRDLQTQRDQEERHRIADTLDIEIKRWSAGKEGNLRALLSTMQYVLWPECGWQPVSLTDLITGASVKKVYRKATLCIHPDKVQQKGANLQQKYIAEKVFDLLKEAWNKFNSEELF